MTFPSLALETVQVVLLGTPYFAMISEMELELSGRITPYFAAMMEMESETEAESVINGPQMSEGHPYRSTGASRELLLERNFWELELLLTLLLLASLLGFVALLAAVSALDSALEATLEAASLDAALIALELDDALVSSALDAALVSSGSSALEAALFAWLLLERSALDATLVSSALDVVLFALELDETPSVSAMELDGASSFTATGLEDVSSQLAQKNPVRASTIFFQCLYSIFCSFCLVLVGLDYSIESDC